MTTKDILAITRRNGEPVTLEDYRVAIKNYETVNQLHETIKDTYEKLALIEEHCPHTFVTTTHDNKHLCVTCLKKGI